MTTILATDFLADARFALFVDMGTVTVQTLLDEAEADICRMLPPTQWGDRFLRAIRLLAAHRLTMAMNAQAGIAIAGSISNINVSNGSQSAGFGGGSSSAEDPEAYATTVYGREFAAIVRGLPLAGFVI